MKDMTKILMTVGEIKEMIREEENGERPEGHPAHRASTVAGPPAREPSTGAAPKQSTLYQALKKGAPFVRITRPKGQIYDVTLDGDQLVVQQKTLQAKHEPIRPSGDDVMHLEKNWNLEHGLDSNNSWIPGREQ